MKRHTTECKQTESAMPRQTRKMTAQEIVAYRQQVNEGTKTAEFMQQVADTYFDPNRWKNPFYAKCPQDADRRYLTEWVKAAVIWFHGREAYETFIGVGSHGYAC